MWCNQIWMGILLIASEMKLVIFVIPFRWHYSDDFLFWLQQLLKLRLMPILSYFFFVQINYTWFVQAWICFFVRIIQFIGEHWQKPLQFNNSSLFHVLFCVLFNFLSPLYSFNDLFTWLVAFLLFFSFNWFHYCLFWFMAMNDKYRMKIENYKVLLYT